jgi:SAM-dependent methyltransferase
MAEPTDVATAWTRVAPAWDAHVAYIDERSDESTSVLLDRVAIRPGDRVLELAAGPGSLGATLSEQTGPSGEVVLSDVSPGMVDVATRRTAALGNVTCRVLDAASIDGADGAFDVVVSRMGLMFLPDPSVGFAEMHRVLENDGRVGVMTWGAMEHNAWMVCVGMSAAIAGIAGDDGPPVGPGGIFSLGDPDHVRTLAVAAGFHDVTVDVLDLMFRAPDLDTHISRVGALAGPLAAAIDSATDDQRAAMRRTAADIARPYETDEGFELPGQVVIVSGRRSPS